MPGHLGGDGQAEDGVGALVGGLLEGGLEGAGGGGGGLGQVALAAAALPELGRRELAPVLELLGAEADGQRHHDDVVLLDELVGQVAGTVGDDVDAGHAGSLATEGRAAGRLGGAGQFGRVGGPSGSAARWTRRARASRPGGSPGGAGPASGRADVVGLAPGGHGTGGPIRHGDRSASPSGPVHRADRSGRDAARDRRVGGPSGTGRVRPGRTVGRRTAGACRGAGPARSTTAPKVRPPATTEPTTRASRPGDAGRRREVGDHEHDDGHRDGGDDDADQRRPRLALGQAPEPLVEDGQREQRRHACRRWTATARGRARRAGGRAARASTMLSAFSTR